MSVTVIVDAPQNEAERRLVERRFGNIKKAWPRSSDVAPMRSSA
ncbi:hypothetical protein [Lysobacter enzymogenes]|nr:hypothetical protein [Lysobacter enzymogenes]